MRERREGEMRDQYEQVERQGMEGGRRREGRGERDGGEMIKYSS